MHPLKGKVALVTGGAGGIGAVIARAMAGHGAAVVIGDVLEHEGRALVQELGAAALYAHLDVTRPAEWEAAVAAAVERFGRLNVLVNNAGIASLGPVGQYRHPDWDRIIEVNLTGPYRGIQAVLPALKQARKASIINVSSIADLRDDDSLPGYIATKWAVRGLTRDAALDLAPYGIRVNSVHPGVVRTAPTADGPDTSIDHSTEERVGRPFEIANLVVFLASDESSLWNGTELIADGQELAGIIRRNGAPAARTRQERPKSDDFLTTPSSPPDTLPRERFHHK